MTDRRITDDIFGRGPRRKKTINSKQKGNANELVCAGVIKSWTGEEFVRIPQSGGLRWKNTMNICGDLVCTNPAFEFIFTVETKHLKGNMFEIDSLGKLRKNSKIGTLWRQAQRDATRAGKLAMLMLRQNGMSSGVYIVFIDWRLSEVLKKKLCLVPSMEWENEEEQVAVAGYFSDLFMSIDYNTISTTIKKSYLYDLLKTEHNEQK